MKIRRYAGGPVAGGLVAAAAVAAASSWVAPPAPSYDPWAWLLWGREAVSGTLSTLEGPAFKPFPVAVTAVLAPLGPAAAWVWVLLARTASLAAVWLAFRLGRRLGGRAPAAGLAAGAAVILTGDHARLAAAGMTEGLLLALGLAGVEAWRAGRHRWALAAAAACALLRVETWPFLVVAGAVAWRRRPQDRKLLAMVALAVPLAWIVPELVGSGNVLRSASRARLPEPGQPALAGLPAAASLRSAVALPLWPLWAGVAVLVRRAWRSGDPAARVALVPAAVGGAWLGLVAAMAQAGFSGESRYAMPGAALVAISGAVGLVTTGWTPAPGRGPAFTAPTAGAGAGSTPRRRRPATAVALVLLGAAALPRLAELPAVARTQAHHWALHRDLARTVAAVGGPGAVLACGQPYVGRLRGPLTAYHLGVPKRAVEPDRPPRPPAVMFRSALERGGEPSPAVPPGFSEVARTAAWVAFASCRPGPGALPATPAGSPLWHDAGPAAGLTGRGHESGSDGDHDGR